ncbi:MAG: hypothetical protein D6732_19690 [Methanobacteriota archaeon]|nr:MAG: hypothetical protein D6732_19690 [Euryarchaeota archaeon]
MTQNKNMSIWVLVKVERGIPVFVEAFWNREEAEVRDKYLRSHMNSENDETGIFEISLPMLKTRSFDKRTWLHENE